MDDTGVFCGAEMFLTPSVQQLLKRDLKFEKNLHLPSRARETPTPVFYLFSDS